MLAPWLELPGAAERLATWSEISGLDLARLGTTATAEEITDTAVTQPLVVAATLLAHEELTKRGLLSDVRRPSSPRPLGRRDRRVRHRRRHLRRRRRLAGRHPRRRDGQGLRARADRHGRGARRRRGRGARPPRGTRPGRRPTATPPARSSPPARCPRWRSSPRIRRPRPGSASSPPQARSTPTTWPPRSTATPPPPRASPPAEPTATLLSNADGQPVTSAADAMTKLVAQLTRPVRWDLCTETMRAARVSPRSSSSRPPERSSASPNVNFGGCRRTPSRSPADLDGLAEL